MRNETLTKELERRHKLICDIPKNKIDYHYFVLIADYIDWIEKNKVLKKLLSNQKTFIEHPPEYYLIKKGWDIEGIEATCLNRTDDELLIAYINLLAVWIAVSDMKRKLDKNDLILENRIKRARHLKNIRDRKKIIGYGHFWLFKDKYNEYIKIVHQKILSLLAYSEDKKENILIPMANRGKESYNKTEEQKSNTISYKYDKTNKTGFLSFGENNKKIIFEKDRALIVYYFYELKNIDKGYKTYRDFNEKMDKDISSPIFRQSIDKINERIGKEHKFITGIIDMKDKNKISEANRYRWKIIT